MTAERMMDADVLAARRLAGIFSVALEVAMWRWGQEARQVAGGAEPRTARALCREAERWETVAARILRATMVAHAAGPGVSSDRMTRVLGGGE